MNANDDKSPKGRWLHLRDNGPLLLVDLKSNETIATKPEWLDEQRWKKAKEAIQKFYIGIQYSSFTGLLLILQLPDGLEPLLSTGNSKDVPSLYQRYLSTVIHVTSWYDDDVFDPESKGYKSLRQVRSMHKRVQKIMNDKFQVKSVDGAPRKWFNQYDVAMTQFAFVGLAMLFPKQSGLIAAKKEELEAINYYWRVLGWLMGLEDEFNLCQFDNYSDIYEFNRLILEHEYKDKFNKLPCEKGLEMTKSICIALHYYLPLLTFNNLAHWWKDCLKFNGYVLQPQTKFELVLEYWQKLSFNHLFKYNGFLNFSNRLHKKRFQTRLLNRDKVYEKLKAQYKDDTKQNYYSDRVNYLQNNSNSEVENDICSMSNELTVDGKSKTDTNFCPFGYEGKQVVTPTSLTLSQEQAVSVY